MKDDPPHRIDELSALLRRTVGLRPDRRRQDAIEAAVERLGAAANVSPAELAERLVSGAAPLQPLVDEITVGETYFFRDPAQWEFIERRVLRTSTGPSALGPPFRAWSAGCSTGEEPYTLAVLLVDRGVAARSSVLATDVSATALERARRAEYSLWSFRGGIDPRLQRHLQDRGGRFALDDDVRRLVSFRSLNLARFSTGELGLEPFDLILCRNVLIYLAPEVVADLAHRLFAALAPGGWLLTGAADPSMARLAPFRIEAGPHGIAHQRPAQAEAASRRATGPGPRASDPARTASRPPIRGPGRVADASAPRWRPTTSTESPQPSPAPRDPPTAHPLPSARSACTRCRDLLDAGRHDDALRAVDEALASAPLDPESHLMRALVLTELGDLPGAEASGRRAVYLDRGAPFPQFFLSMVRLLGGDRDAAARGLRTVLGLCHERPPQEEVPLSSGLTFGALASAARYQLDAISDPGAGLAR